MIYKFKVYFNAILIFWQLFLNFFIALYFCVNTMITNNAIAMA